jgi:hypothetical protein
MSDFHFPHAEVKFVSKVESDFNFSHVFATLAGMRITGVPRAILSRIELGLELTSKFGFERNIRRCFCPDVEGNTEMTPLTYPEFSPFVSFFFILLMRWRGEMPMISVWHNPSRCRFTAKKM